MAVKEWTSDYPTSKDTISNMPDLNDDEDEAVSSQVESVRDAVINLEDKVGSDNLETGSLLYKTNVLYSTRIWVEDEFNNSSINGMWTVVENNGTISEDSSKLTINIPNGVAGEWWTTTFNCPYIYTEIEWNRDFNIECHVSLDSPTSESAAQMTIFLDNVHAAQAWINLVNDCGFGYANGSFGDEASSAFGQSYGWIRLRRRGTYFFMDYNKGDYSNRPLDSEWTQYYARNALDWTMIGNKVVLSAKHWGSLSNTNAYFRNFRLYYL